VVFFAYIGFDAVSPRAQERRILSEICLLASWLADHLYVLYILVSGLLTHLVPYQQLNVQIPWSWRSSGGAAMGHFPSRIGALGGLATVMLVMLLGQSRVFYSMSRVDCSGLGRARFIIAFARRISVPLWWVFLSRSWPL